MNNAEMKKALQEVFFESDQMSLGVVENKLKDEYDGEIDLLLENLGNMDKNRDGVIELLEYVFCEMFDIDWIELDSGFIDNVEKIVL